MDLYLVETPTVTSLVITIIEVVSDVEQKRKEPPTESLGPVGHEVRLKTQGRIDLFRCEQK